MRVGENGAPWRCLVSADGSDPSTMVMGSGATFKGSPPHLLKTQRPSVSPLGGSGDSLAITELMDVVENWSQTAEERPAQVELLDAMLTTLDGLAAA